jgi:hypothetical protein
VRNRPPLLSFGGGVVAPETPAVWPPSAVVVVHIREQLRAADTANPGTNTACSSPLHN